MNIPKKDLRQFNSQLIVQGATQDGDGNIIVDPEGSTGIDIYFESVSDALDTDELPFSKENAEILMKNSGDFDTWVTETVGDLENFTMIK